MITTTTKNEIFNKLQFYYSHTKFSINGLQYTTFAHDYNNESEFEQALYKVNTQIFFRDLIARRGKIIDGVSIEIIKDIPEIIKTEYRLFSRNKTKAENENWLNHTYNFIININDLSRFIGKSDTVAFLDWYDTMIIKQPEHTNNNTDEVNLFCKTMPLSIPKEHFKPLTIVCSKDGKPFLTQEQFNNFINRGFGGKVDLPKIKFNQAPKEKSKIQYLFYQFHQNYSFDYFGTEQTKNVFVKLLTDNFVRWDFENVHGNFNKKPIKML